MASPLWPTTLTISKHLYPRRSAPRYTTFSPTKYKVWEDTPCEWVPVQTRKEKRQVGGKGYHGRVSGWVGEWVTNWVEWVNAEWWRALELERVCGVRTNMRRQWLESMRAFVCVYIYIWERDLYVLCCYLFFYMYRERMEELNDLNYLN